MKLCVVTVRTAFGSDLILCGPRGTWRYAADHVEFAGELLHARVARDGTLQRFIAVDATAFRWQGEARLGTQGAAVAHHRRASTTLVPTERT